MDSADIHERLEEFYRTGSHRIFVDHPMSPRYDRASSSFRELIRDGVAIGVDIEIKNSEKRQYILVLFLEPGPEDALQGIRGQYAAFRVLFKPPGRVTELYAAELFAFYDDDPGSDDGDDKNHGLSTEAEARAFMKKNYPSYVFAEKFYDS